MMKISDYSDQDISRDMTRDQTNMVTSECGIQAASDTVCRGAQVTPLTRDAGCQYEEIPPGKFINMTNIIKPSPIKQSPPKDKQNVFMAAKALQHLYQTPTLRPTGPKELTTRMCTYEVRCKGAFTRPDKQNRGTQYHTSSLPKPHYNKPYNKPYDKPYNKPYTTQSPASTLSSTILQSQIKALQNQALQDNLSRGLKPDTSSQIPSLLQPPSNTVIPNIMNTLPLTSYALLLDMINKDTVNNNQNIINHLTELQLSKEEGGSFGSLTSSVTVANRTESSTPLLERRNNPTSLFNTSNSNIQGLLGNSSWHSNETHNIPSMISKSQQMSFNNHKRGHAELLAKKDVDSLVDTVIDEHMNNARRENANNTYKEHLSNYSASNQHCLLSRDMEYEMTPPFKRRRRTVFTERQLQGLEEAYTKSQYLDRESRLELCKKLSLSLHTVVYWFQNKRAISRRRGHSLDSSRSNENIHALASAGSSPILKSSPPTSPPGLNPYCTTRSPLNINASMCGVQRSPTTQGPSLQSPPSMTNMSISSSIPKSVLNVSHMVGATI